ncbi:MAG TPA: dienelactone hydrolase family protein [Gammaproteobacteria bacterium]|nr:dienelactone hydrolase family protein [Gammaproteobacteria bacterium]
MHIEIPEKLIEIQLEDVILEGMLSLPKDAKGLVVFAHGSGSSRLSPRNNYVASVLRTAGLGTLLIDLLTAEEDEVYATRFDIELLTERLLAIVLWLKTQKSAQFLPIGLFGASTGAAAALKVAASQEVNISAVVSRGGRPDLALDELPRVMAPTLLIVGGNDFGVIELNQQAYSALSGVRKMEIVPGATHLFEEPGTLEKVSELTAAWFLKYFSE